MLARRLPRVLHPGSWWIWSLGLATAASRTTNPILLMLLISVAAFVVINRRGNNPAGRGFRAYLVLGLVVIGVRVVFRVLLGSTTGTHHLFPLPEIALPDWAVGVRLGGPVYLEGVLAAAYDGVRLAAMLLCLGAANSLADHKRLLRSVPRALHDVGASLVVAMSLAPQLIDSAVRVRRVRMLRGDPVRGTGSLRSFVIPVLEDAMSKSLTLAATMESRGYGHQEVVPSRSRLATPRVFMTAGILGVAIGLFGLLDGTSNPGTGIAPLLIGLALAVVGLVVGGTSVDRSRYRHQPWKGEEWAVAGAGIASAVLLFVTARFDAAELNPSLQPLRWPEVSLWPTLAILIAGLAVLFSPPPTFAPTR